MLAAFGGRVICTGTMATSAIAGAMLICPSVEAALTALNNFTREANSPTRFLFSTSTGQRVGSKSRSGPVPGL